MKLIYIYYNLIIVTNNLSKVSQFAPIINHFF